MSLSDNPGNISDSIENNSGQTRHRDTARSHSPQDQQNHAYMVCKGFASEYKSKRSGESLRESLLEVLDGSVVWTTFHATAYL
ncbi:hypothetical protein E4U57_004703 [Claviceps arundinis]|uniref:Uncharacterized protein n=1 Tax=Claviceps arundinis TaxID=1623583 RepID=A0ABQ7P4Q1_9HYPO|nr:hypothetical protein E4U57_004703 [Claviceps arundinis]